MYQVKVATVTNHSTSDTVEGAMESAATYMRTSPDAVALVMDGENSEAVVVFHNNWAYQKPSS